MYFTIAPAAYGAGRTARAAVSSATVGMLLVRDEAPGAETVEFALDLGATTAELTVGELIRGRVTAELTRSEPPPRRPLLERSPAEAELNGPRPPAAPDLEHEIARALDAFRRGRFVLLAGGTQLHGLDDVVTLAPGEPVTFLRLVPLRGG
jgi:hypothetical protein